MSEKTNEVVDLKAVAHLRNVRISNRKVKIVADLIRNKNVEDALNKLWQMQKTITT